MRKFVLHAGFHKTATSTVQMALETQIDLLSEYVEILPRKLLKPVRKSAQLFSIDHDPMHLAMLEAFLAEILLSLNLDDPRPVLASSEDFSGYLIGRHGVPDYRAAPHIAAAVQQTLMRVCPDAFELTVYYSTRRTNWLRSCHWQLISNSTEAISFEEFKHRYAHAADFEPILTQVAQAVDPGPVFAADIENFNGRLGPLQPLLELCDIPKEAQAQLTLPSPQNVGGSEALVTDLLNVTEELKQNGAQDRQILKARRALIRQAKKR